MRSSSRNRGKRYRDKEESRAERDRILKLDEDRNMKFLEALRRQTDFQASSSCAGPPGSLSARADSAFHGVRAFLSKMNPSGNLVVQEALDASTVVRDAVCLVNELGVMYHQSTKLNNILRRGSVERGLDADDRESGTTTARSKPTFVLSALLGFSVVVPL